MYTELIAISEAISYADSLKFNNYIILTDSKSAIYHLARCTSNFRGTPIAYRILESLRRLSDKNKLVKIQWIPSHVGIPGNEEADRLAKDALIHGTAFYCLPLFSDCLGKVRDRCTELWKEHFDERSISKGVWYKTIQPSISRASWYLDADMSRTDMVTAMRLRSGHIPLNKFLHLMGKSDSPNCSECGVVEDVYHVVMECVRTEAERFDFNQQTGINTNDVGWCNSILADPLSEEARLLVKLVNMCIIRR